MKRAKLSIFIVLCFNFPAVVVHILMTLHYILQAGAWLWHQLNRGVGPYTVLAVRNEDIDRWAADTFTYYRVLHDTGLLNQVSNCSC